MILFLLVFNLLCVLRLRLVVPEESLLLLLELLLLLLLLLLLDDEKPVPDGKL